MKLSRISFITVLLFCFLIAGGLACGLPVQEGLTFSEIDRTYAVQTVVYQLSQTLPATEQATPESSATQTQTLAMRPLPTWTQQIGPGPTVTSTITRAPCDQFEFVMDVTVPSGTAFNPGDRFDKIWRLRNTGSCQWSPDYALVFVEGDGLSAPESIPLPGLVQPQQEVDIRVPMSAPADLGRYRGGWKLRNAGGKLISLPDGRPVYINVEVVAPSTYRLVYPFAENACLVEWQSSASGIFPLDCPGEPVEAQGYVVARENPLVEDNRQAETIVLETHPPMESHPLWNLDEQGGWISGTYPPISIPTGSHFRAQLGCMDNASTCDVDFSLYIRIPGLSWQELGFWHQEYDDSLSDIDINLSDFVGLNAEFQLWVSAAATPGMDQAAWLNPRIEVGLPN